MVLLLVLRGVCGCRWLLLMLLGAAVCCSLVFDVDCWFVLRLVLLCVVCCCGLLVCVGVAAVCWLSWLTVVVVVCDVCCCCIVLVYLRLCVIGIVCWCCILLVSVVCRCCWGCCIL